MVQRRRLREGGGVSLWVDGGSGMAAFSQNLMGADAQLTWTIGLELCDQNLLPMLPTPSDTHHKSYRAIPGQTPSCSCHPTV
jgi:hypothetical protein